MKTRMLTGLFNYSPMFSWMSSVLAAGVLEGGERGGGIEEGSWERVCEETAGRGEVLFALAGWR